MGHGQVIVATVLIKLTPLAAFNGHVSVVVLVIVLETLVSSSGMRVLRGLNYCSPVRSSCVGLTYQVGG